MHAPFMSFLSHRDALVLPETTSIAYRIGGRPGAMPTLVETSRPLCTVGPKQTEGPYFVDDRLPRSDIRPDPAVFVKAGRYIEAEGLGQLPHRRFAITSFGIEYDTKLIFPLTGCHGYQLPGGIYTVRHF